MSLLGLMWALGMCYAHISRKGSSDAKPCFVFVNLSYPAFSVYLRRLPIFTPLRIEAASHLYPAWEQAAIPFIPRLGQAVR
jgi:hypothetical protein